MVKSVSDPSQLPPDEYLEEEEVWSLYTQLMEHRNSLIESTMKAMNELTENQDNDPDSLDLAVSQSNRELSLRFANRERRMLKKINYALETIQNGEYGICESCGDPIGYKRLSFRPVARLCIHCKTQQELLER
ncbi:MAG: TraR/DksA C4-type zinc finger protein [Myxococcota bacterium]|nr:TraR/DksA C4-type zinc finger protein [Myxococcota bacterium]